MPLMVEEKLLETTYNEDGTFTYDQTGGVLLSHQNIKPII